MFIGPQSHKRVLPAFGTALLLHVLVLAIWPHMQPTLSQSVIVTGELVAPPVPAPPPEIVPPPPLPEPPPPPEPVKPDPELRSKPDTGVALPVLAAKPDESNAQAADYVVAEAPPLNNDDEIPLGSKVGGTAIEDYVPSPGTETSDLSGDGRGSEDPVDRDALNAFGEGLRERAAGFGKYPALAQRRGWQGMVKVRLRYDRLGEVYQIDVSESSGHKVLDEQAVAMLKQASARYQLPEALVKKAFSVIVPIDFKLQ